MHLSVLSKIILVDKKLHDMTISKQQLPVYHIHMSNLDPSREINRIRKKVRNTCNICCRKFGGRSDGGGTMAVKYRIKDNRSPERISAHTKGMFETKKKNL